MQNLLKDLNVNQKKAVVYGQGPLLIIAGAGTGKTKVITHRIAYLISSKLARPEEILAVTFTEKAANEMEERVDVLIPYSYSFVEISTFNSFGERILRNYGHELGYDPDFKLLDDVEQSIFFRENLFQFPLKYYRPLSSPTKHIQEILGAIKRLKQEDIEPEGYLDYVKKYNGKKLSKSDEEWMLKHHEMVLVYEKYQQLLRKESKIDFEDQIVLVVELFRRRPSVLKLIQDKYKYILVDEFQDTNYIQFELLKLIAAKHRNLTVVGDDDQSIFRFRGASLSNIHNFRKIYPNAEKIVLTKNYRSTQDILDSSYRLIQHNNPDRLEVEENINKLLESDITTRGKSIYVLQFDTFSHEADRISEIILEKNKQGYRFGDIAILVRRNSDANPYLRALNMKEIPFRFSGSRGLYAQKEIKILISFIKALTNFEDSNSLFYLAISEVYEMDQYDLTKISNYAFKKNISLHNAFKEIFENKQIVDVSLPSKEKVKKIFQDLLNFTKLASSLSAGRLLYCFLENTGYLKSLAQGKSLRSELKVKNIRIFFDKVKNFSDLTEDDSVYSFAKHLDLLQQVGDNPASAEAELEEDAVNVLTVHKAKGLEFPVVFMVSLISDRFPGRERKEKIPIPDEILKDKVPKGSGYDKERQEKIYFQEERRLFYVGMTRAKKYLYISWARDYGLKRLKKVSPFVLEALDLSQTPNNILRTSPLEEIKRYAPPAYQSNIIPRVRERGFLSLSYFKVNDYLLCPLRYKLRHVMRIPVLPNYNLVFGRVLHNVIHFYLKKRMKREKITEKELIKEYEFRWINEGYLSREHEEMRKKAGEKALRLFYHRQESSEIMPNFLEKSFKWQFDDVKFIGRWDRIDYEKDGAVIVDFKATEVKDQKEADKKTRDSLQMDVYALAFTEINNLPLLETQLYFLESDIIGHAKKGNKELQRALEKIKIAEVGIRSHDYRAKPDWHNCNLCDFRTICPSSYAY